MSYALTVNGRRLELDVAGMTPLAHVLREDLGLTGAKIGCFEGRCGACTVVVDGRAVTACILPVGLVAGAEVRTVESLAPRGGPLAPIQAAMLEAGGVQCGVCTPGILMSLTALLERNPRPTEEEAKAALAGNLCRCTGYRKILDAVAAVAAGSAP